MWSSRQQLPCHHHQPLLVRPKLKSDHKPCNHKGRTLCHRLLRSSKAAQASTTQQDTTTQTNPDVTRMTADEGPVQPTAGTPRQNGGGKKATSMGRGRLTASGFVEGQGKRDQSDTASSSTQSILTTATLSNWHNSAPPQRSGDTLASQAANIPKPAPGGPPEQSDVDSDDDEAEDDWAEVGEEMPYEAESIPAKGRRRGGPVPAGDYFTVVKGPPKKAVTEPNSTTRAPAKQPDGNERFEDLMEGQEGADSPDLPKGSSSSPASSQHRADGASGRSTVARQEGGVSTHDISRLNGNTNRPGLIPGSSTAQQLQGPAAKSTMLSRLRYNLSHIHNRTRTGANQQTRLVNAPDSWSPQLAAASRFHPGADADGSSARLPTRPSADPTVLHAHNRKAVLGSPPQRSAIETTRQEMPRSYPVRSHGQDRPRSTISGQHGNAPPSQDREPDQPKSPQHGNDPGQPVWAAHRMGVNPMGPSARLSQLRAARRDSTVKVMQSQHTKEALQHLPDIHLHKGWEQPGFQPGHFSRLFIEQGFLTPDMQLVEGCPSELLSAKINKLILLSSQWQTSLHLVRDLHMHFEPINISIALHRPVKHLKTARIPTEKFLQHAEYATMKAVFKRLLPVLEPRQLCNTLWAFASYYDKDSSILEPLCRRLRQSEIPSLQNVEISNAVWAHAKLYIHYNGGFIQQCAEEMTTWLEDGIDMSVQCVSNMTWALAKLNIKQEAYCKAVGQFAEKHLKEMSTQAIANTVFGLGLLRYSHGGFLHALADHLSSVEPQTDTEFAMPVIDRYNTQELSSVVVAFSRLGFYHLPFLQALETEMAKPARLAQLTSQSIINMLHAFAVLHFYPPTFLETAAAMLIKIGKTKSFSDQEMSNILYAFGKLAHHPGDEMLTFACSSLDAMVSKGRAMSMQACSNCLWSLAVLTSCNPTIVRLVQYFAFQPDSRILNARDAVSQLHQLCQGLLLARLEANATGDTELAQALIIPKHVEETALGCWKEYTTQTHMSVLQRTVSDVLVKMGISHQNEYLAENGLFSVDMALLDIAPGQKVCLEVDGPYHFANNCHQPLGHTILRRKHLTALGWTIVCVPYYEWTPLEDDAARITYLAKTMARHGVQPPTSPTPLAISRDPAADVAPTVPSPPARATATTAAIAAARAAAIAAASSQKRAAPADSANQSSRSLQPTVTPSQAAADADAAADVRQAMTDWAERDPYPQQTRAPFERETGPLDNDSKAFWPARTSQSPAADDMGSAEEIAGQALPQDQRPAQHPAQLAAQHAQHAAKHEERPAQQMQHAANRASQVQAGTNDEWSPGQDLFLEEESDPLDSDLADDDSSVEADEDMPAVATAAVLVDSGLNNMPDLAVPAQAHDAAEPAIPVSGNSVAERSMSAAAASGMAAAVAPVVLPAPLSLAELAAAARRASQAAKEVHAVRRAQKQQATDEIAAAVEAKAKRKADKEQKVTQAALADKLSRQQQQQQDLAYAVPRKRVPSGDSRREITPSRLRRDSKHAVPAEVFIPNSKSVNAQQQPQQPQQQTLSKPAAPQPAKMKVTNKQLKGLRQQAGARQAVHAADTHTAPKAPKQQYKGFYESLLADEKTGKAYLQQALQLAYSSDKAESSSRLQANAKDMVVGASDTNGADETDATDDDGSFQPHSLAELKEMRMVQELRPLCREYGLTTTGRKDLLVLRVLAHEAGLALSMGL